MKTTCRTRHSCFRTGKYGGEGKKRGLASVAGSPQKTRSPDEKGVLGSCHVHPRLRWGDFWQTARPPEPRCAAADGLDRLSQNGMHLRIARFKCEQLQQLLRSNRAWPLFRTSTSAVWSAFERGSAFKMHQLLFLQKSDGKLFFLVPTATNSLMSEKCSLK